MLTAVLPLLVMLSVMAAQAVFCNDFRPYVPLILGSAVALVNGVIKGHKWKDLSKETFRFVGSVSSALILYMLIGPTISSWMASGTLPTLMIWGSRIMSPAAYLPLCFVVMAVSCIFMGTTVAVIGTMGVAMCGIGLAFGYPIWHVAAVIGTGAGIGNACSPLSGVNIVSLSFTQGDASDYIYYMIPRLFVPFVAITVLYAVIGFFYHPGVAQAQVQTLQALAEYMPPSVMSIVPLIILIILLLLRIPSLIVFFVTIAISCIFAVFMGNISLTKIPDVIVSGFRYTGPDASLAAILDRGGIMSTASLVYTVMIAMFFGGSLEASGCLNRIMEGLTKHVRGTDGLRRMAVASTLFITIATSSATLGTTLSGTLFASRLKQVGLDTREITATLSPTAVLVAVLVPWGPSGTSLINFLNIPLSEPSSLLYIPLSFGCYIAAAWMLFVRPGLWQQMKRAGKA